MRNKVPSFSPAHEGLVVLLPQVHYLLLLPPERSAPAFILGDYAVYLTSLLRLQQGEEPEVPSCNGPRGAGQDLAVGGGECADDGRPSEGLRGGWATMAATAKAERLKLRARFLF